MVATIIIIVDTSHQFIKDVLKCEVHISFPSFPVLGLDIIFLHIHLKFLKCPNLY